MDPSLFTDTQLMALVRVNSEPAVEELVKRYGGLVTRLCRRLVHDAADAEDLTQDIFLRTLRASSTWEPRARLTTWLYRVATNCCLTHLEKRKRRRVVPLTHATAAVSCEDGYHTTRETELQHILEAQLRKLPPAQRSAFVLKELEDLSYAQVARILDIPEGTVKTNVHRARQKLRVRMSPHLKPQITTGRESCDG